MAELLSSTDLKFLQAKGTRLNKKKENANLFMKIVIPRSVRLVLSAEK